MVRMVLRRRRIEIGRGSIELGRRNGATVMVRMGLRRRRFELGRGGYRKERKS